MRGVRGLLRVHREDRIPGSGASAASAHGSLKSQPQPQRHKGGPVVPGGHCPAPAADITNGLMSWLAARPVYAGAARAEGGMKR